jgi:hypothetical protein
MISGNNCNVIGGNSGSGLFNEQGQLIGAIHQKLDVSKLEEIFSTNMIQFDKLTYVGMAVNYACISSLVSTSSYKCGSEKFELSFDEYMNSKKKEFSVDHLEDSQIEAVITSNLSVRLSDGGSSLSSFKSLEWLKSRFNTLGGSTAFRKILQNY